MTAWNTPALLNTTSSAYICSVLLPVTFHHRLLSTGAPRETEWLPVNELPW